MKKAECSMTNLMRMNTKLTWVIASLALATFDTHAQTTINATNKLAWSANTGWIDFRAGRPNATDGFQFGQYTCSGFLWSPNLGWINCGNGMPANGVRYDNTFSTDFGVNHQGNGDLAGLAWSGNTGWINFGWWTATPTNEHRPRVNLVTGEFSGYAWSANCGWVNLGFSGLKTDRMAIPDRDGDGISDPFEIIYTGNYETMTSTTDLDGDGASDLNESIAGTNPSNPNDALRITRISKLTGVNAVELEWASNPTRVYDLDARPSLNDTNWVHLGTVPGMAGASTVQAIEAGPPAAFFRIGAKLPLQP